MKFTVAKHLNGPGSTVSVGSKSVTFYTDTETGDILGKFKKIVVSSTPFKGSKLVKQVDNLGKYYFYYQHGKDVVQICKEAFTYCGGKPTMVLYFKGERKV